MTDAVIIGIDNGISGALIALDVSRNMVVHTSKTPLREIGKDRSIDQKELAGLIAKWCEPYSNAAIIFEQGQKFPGFGCKGNFSNGYSFGVVHTIAELSGLPYRIVNPQTWQKWAFQDMRGLKKGNTKGASYEYVKRNYPNFQTTKSNDGVNDAICMGAYGRNVVWL